MWVRKLPSPNNLSPDSSCQTAQQRHAAPAPAWPATAALRSQAPAARSGPAYTAPSAAPVSLQRGSAGRCLPAAQAPSTRLSALFQRAQHRDGRSGAARSAKAVRLRHFFGRCLRAIQGQAAQAVG